MNANILDDKKPVTWFSLVLLLITFIFYSNVIYNHFSMDDYHVNINNPIIAKGISGIPEIWTSLYAEESGMEIPPFPMVFTKHTSCIVGPFEDIQMRSDIVDYEAELVVVIGKKGKNITIDNAWEHVAGLTVGQDISDRAVQFHATPPQFNLGKSFDTFGPIGPYLVSPDSVANKNAVHLECHINNELRQESSTDDLIFTVPDIISYISEFLTLNTGDLIFTGTPSGVGATQGKLLKDGDIITTSIKEIGTIKNKCIRINDHSNISYMPEFLKGRIPTNDDS